MNEPTDSREIAAGDLPDYLRRAASAVYIAMDKVAADDLSPRLLEAANLLDRLTRQNDRLTMELQHRAGQDIERRKRMDAAGTRAAPCSGRHHNNWCTTCGHDPGDHNEQLICLICHELCDYCGMFRDQHTDTEWASCQRDLEAVDNDHE